MAGAIALLAFAALLVTWGLAVPSSPFDCPNCRQWVCLRCKRKHSECTCNWKNHPVTTFITIFSVYCLFIAFVSMCGY